MKFVGLYFFAWLCAGAVVTAAEPVPSTEQIEFFENKIRPVLVRECYECHAAGDKPIQGGLHLDSRAALLRGGDSGPALVPGNAKESLLIAALKHESFEMPPKGKLSDQIIADFATWIDRGAADPRDADAAPVAKQIDFAAARKFWSFQTPIRPARPQVRDAKWPRGEIDYFILAALEADGLRPVAPATKRELIRRATFDLIGLPPTPEEIEAFLTDDSAEAFARVIDRLLESPHYGERWGRYWLDVARYAEDQAHTFGVKPSTSAYRYRDWVVAAFNADLPYDQFVKLQIAADSYDKQSSNPIQNAAALGFFGLGAQYYKNTDAAKATADELDDRVDVLTRGFLGLTVSCARCHDHKFDPIPTQDYYSLAGIFSSCKLTDTPLAPADEVAVYAAAMKRSQDASNDLKSFLSEQKRLVAESYADQIADYLRAAWEILHGEPANARTMTKRLAQERKLNEAKLTRWTEFIKPGSPLKTPTIGEFRKAADAANKAAAPVPTPVSAAADAFMQRVQSILAARDKPAKPGTKPTAEEQEVLKLIFSDRGLFAADEGELKRQLPADKMQRWDECKQAVADAQKAVPPMYAVAHTVSDSTSVDMKIFIRGNPARQGDLAPRRFLRVMAGDDAPRFTKGSGRRELAESIADPQNPLTARVMVNRLWQHHFGRGIVNTPSNFGLLGDRPTHPELLDYLAVRFVESGWSMKAMHREMMLSAVYQLSSQNNAQNAERDADNRNWWRMPRQRLDVEAWRDAMLAVSGRLDPTVGGPSTTSIDAVNSTRRTLYGKISRHDLNGLLRLFDFPDANITADVRSETTVPQQQLFVLNSPFVAEQARSFVKRLHREGKKDDDAGRVRHAFELAYGRPADEVEVQAAVAYVTTADAPTDAEQNKLTRWERLAQALLSANEFLYLD